MNITLIVNSERDPKKRVSTDVVEILKKQGAEVSVIANGEKLPELCDLAITIGGDGTLLHTSKQAAFRSIPILGINTGHLGFLAGLENSEISILEQLPSKNFKTENRMLLYLELRRDRKTVYEDIALNDIVVSHGETMRVIPLSLYCDDMMVKEFRGDGLIISSPTGSTAYSLSAGGPVVDPLAESITATPLNAHAIYAKSFVFSEKRTITCTIGALENRTAFLSADGREAIGLRSGDLVRVKKADYYLKLVKMKEESFFSTLYRKL